MTVELIDMLGNDLSIVNAARVSVHARSEAMTDKDRALLRRLARDRHGTPFEHLVFTFRVRVPIKVAREWQRHRIGSFNEESTRYVEMRPDFYVPDAEAVRYQIGKAMAYQFETATESAAEWVQVTMQDAYRQAYVLYQALLQANVARELASFLLPLGLLTEFVWTVNFRSLTNFLSLRTAPNALLEIRREAEAIERLIVAAVPETYAAWREAGAASYSAGKVPL